MDKTGAFKVEKGIAEDQMLLLALENSQSNMEEKKCCKKCITDWNKDNCDCSCHSAGKVIDRGDDVVIDKPWCPTCGADRPPKS